MLNNIIILKKSDRFFLYLCYIVIDTSEFENYGYVRSRCQNFPPGENIVGFLHKINAIYFFLSKLTMITRKLPQ
jgi:hypothetical protein